MNQALFVSARLRLLAAAALATVAFSSSAIAGAISASSGNTQPSKSPDDSATVNFAVYDRTSGAAGDTFGTGVSGFDSLFAAGTSSQGLDTSASFLYLYQTVANGNTSSNVFQNTVGVPSSLVTSFGSFAGTTFSTSVLGTAAGFANPSSASTGATPVILSGQSGLTGFTGANSVSDGLSSVKANYFGTEVPFGGASVLWGFTSDTAPSLGNTAILESTGAGGTASTAVPEPSAALAGVLALGGFGAMARRKRRPQA